MSVLPAENPLALAPVSPFGDVPELPALEADVVAAEIRAGLRPPPAADEDAAGEDEPKHSPY